MKRGAFLVNAARGPLVDASAVARALRSGHLGGFATDVLELEPPPADHPLMGVPGVIITPHIAWATEAARVRLLEATRTNIAAFLAAAPINVVS
jgi:glycerate dehydrogenase